MKKILTFLWLSLLPLLGFSQCELIDGNGVSNANPVWISCTGGNYTLFIQSNTTFGAFSIDWGDGSPVTNGASLVPPAFVSHTYTAAVANYTLTFTELGGTNCVITGTVVMEEPVNASIQIPIGGVTQICAPGDMLFTNSSTDVSSNTTFTWDFGDGSPIQTFGDTNAGQTVTHTYLQGTVNCVTQVTLTAENFCSFGNPTVASFNPIQIFDIDDAQITASNTLLCYPDTVVHFDNTTNRNCVPQGNVAQRYEYWNFGNYWGTGSDSIINWQPFDPPTRPGYDIAFPGLGTYTIMMIDSNQCGQDTAYSTIVITNPPVAGISASDDTICAGDQVTFMNLTTGGANQYLWDFDLGNGFQNLNGNNKTRTYNNPGTYTITLVTNITGGTASCTDTAEVTIEVLPSPTAGINVSNASDCDTLDVTFTDASFLANTYFWDFGNGDTSSLQNPPAQTYTAPGNYTVTLQVSGNNGCLNSTSTTVTVYQSPVVGITANNVCEDVLASFVDASTSAAGDPIVSWNWDFGDMTAGSTAQNPNHVYVDSGSYTVTLQVNTANCFGIDSLPVTVESRPTAAFTQDTISGCTPLVVSFNNTSTGANNYIWDFGDGNTSFAVNPTHTFVNNSVSDTTFTVSLIAQTAFGCSDTVTSTVTVFFKPIASFTVDDSVGCGPMPVAFTNTSIGATSLIWDFGDTTGSSLANPTHTYQNTTLFNTIYTPSLIITGANGCIDTTSSTIQVFPQPIFDFTPLPDSGCSPLSVSFVSQTATVAVGFQWDFGDGTTSNGINPTHLFVNNTTNNQSFNVQLITTSSANCFDTANTTILVHPNPVADFTAVPDTGCEPLTVNLTNNSTGAVNFNWDFGDGSTSDTTILNFTHTYENAGTTPVDNTLELIVETADGCFDTTSTLIHVYPRITADFTSDTIGCHPFSVAFTDLSTGVDSYFWDFGDGDTAQSAAPTHVFTNTTNADVTYTVQLVTTSIFGCTDTLIQDIIVHPKPLAAFTPSDTVGCHPLAVNFQNNTNLAVNYIWDFGDGDTSMATGANIPHTYQNLGSAPVFNTMTLIVESVNGCRDTADQVIETYPVVISGYIPSDTVGCHPLTLSFTDTTTNAVVYAWDFGDGDTSSAASPTHTFTNTTNVDVIYPVQLIVTSTEGCTDTFTLNVRVHPKPLAAFTPSDTVGCHPLAINFQNNTNLAVNYIWDFGDGDTSMATGANIGHTYTNFGSAPVFNTMTLIVESVNGCRDTADQVIETYPIVVSGYIPSDTVGCHPLTLSFTDTSTNAAIYFWDFGDGDTSSAASPTHTFTNFTNADVIYPVQMQVTSAEGCTDVFTLNVRVHPKPLAAFTPSDTVGCHPLVINFQNNTNLALNYIWDFGDGDTSMATGANVGHTYTNFGSVPVIHNMNLLVESADGCRDTASQDIEVYPIVISGFIPSDTIGCSALTVHFTDTSTNAAIYHWDFGDGDTSNLAAPSHTYVNTTNFDVTYTALLTVTSNEGCTDALSVDIVVHPKPTAQFTVNDTVGCQPLAAAFINNSNLALNYIWDFGDGDTSNSAAVNIFHTYTNTGVSTVTYPMVLIVESVDGCLDTATQDIEVYPQIIANYLPSDTVGCTPLTVTFSNLSIGAAAFAWDFGDGFSVTGIPSPTHTYTNANLVDVTYPARLVAISQEGCSDTLIQDILIHPKPIASFNMNPTSVCHGLPTTFINNSNLATYSLWDFGNSVFDTISTLNFDSIFVNQSGLPINRTINLVVETQFGCRDTATQVLEIFPQVIAAFSLEDSSCSPLNATFINNSTGATVFNWDFGDGSAPVSVSLPNHQFVNNGIADVTYTVTLAVENQYGCQDTAQQNVTIHPEPIAGFTATPANQVFPAATVNLGNTTNPGPWQWAWDFGDGDTSSVQNPGSHTYSTWGTFNIQLVAFSDFCMDTTIRTIVIDPPLPVPNFTGAGEGCKPLTVEFVNTSIFGVSYLWDFGDGGTSTLENPPPYTYFNAGVYTVSLTVTGPGGDVATEVKQDIVVVHETPIAFFDLNPKKVIIPTQTVQFFNFSNFATTYFWDFGDGGTSVEEFPEHKYEEEGSYPVTLIASNDFGCIDTFTLPTPVIAEAAGEIIFPNAFTPNSTGPTDGIYDPNSLTNEIFFPVYNGVIGYKLMIFNRWGEMIFETTDVNQGWDGYYRGELCQQDVYVWKVIAQLSNGNQLVKVGDVTLLR